MTESLLLTMNDDVMRTILEFVDYCGIQTLRKTCHTLRNFIDDTLPAPNTSTINIKTEYEKITFDLRSPMFDLPLRIVYHHKDNGVLVEKETQSRDLTVPPEKLKLLENSDFTESFFADFDLFLRFFKSQKSHLEHFELTLCARYSSEFCEKIQKSLEKLHILNTSSLCLRIHEGSEVLTLLPFFSAENLKTLEISNAKMTNEDLDLAPICEMEQWKQADFVMVSFFTVKGVERFLKFSRAMGSFVTIQVDETRVMMETFCTSPTFRGFQLNYVYIDQPVFQIIGEHPYDDRDDLGRARRRWFWKTWNPQEMLHIEQTWKFMLFRIVGIEQLPEKAFLHG